MSFPTVSWPLSARVSEAGVVGRRLPVQRLAARSEVSHRAILNPPYTPPNAGNPCLLGISGQDVPFWRPGIDPVASESFPGSLKLTFGLQRVLDEGVPSSF